MINIHNININYIEEKPDNFDINQEVVLFLHGWGASLDCFIPSVNLIKQKYRVFAIDLPGFGKSEEPKTSFNLDDYCDLIIDFIKSFDTKNIILVGHSYGGRIVIKLNNRKQLPFNITRNILIDAAGIKHKLSFKTNIKIKTFKFLKRISKIIPNEKLKKDIEDRLKKKFGSNDYANVSNVMRETMVKSISEDLSQDIKNIDKETLIIWGEKDTATPLSDAKYMEENIKNSGLVVLKNCGHFSFLEDQNTYLSVIKSYLNI